MVNPSDCLNRAWGACMHQRMHLIISACTSQMCVMQASMHSVLVVLARLPVASLSVLVQHHQSGEEQLPRMCSRCMQGKTPRGSPSPHQGAALLHVCCLSVTVRLALCPEACHTCGTVQALRHLTAAILTSRLRSSTALPRTRITSGRRGCSKAYGIWTASCTNPSNHLIAYSERRSLYAECMPLHHVRRSGKDVPCR